MLKIITKAKWLMSGNIIFAFSQWLTLTLIARNYSTLELGMYSYALSIVAPIFLLTNLQLRSLFIADYNSEKTYSYNAFFRTRISTSILGLLVCILWGWLTNQNYFFIIFLLGLVKVFESLSDIIYAWYNANNRTKLITKSLLLKSILSLILLLIVIYQKYNFYFSIIAILLGYLIILSTIDLKSVKDQLTNTKIDKSEFFKLVLYASPLGFTVMLVSLQSNMPRYFIENYQSLELVGVFTIFSYFLTIGGIIINSLCQFLSPYYSKAWANNQHKDFNKYLFVSWTIAGLFGICSYMVTYTFGTRILNLLYGDKFSIYIDSLNILMLAGIFLYLSIVNGFIMTSIKIIKSQVPMFIILLLLTILTSWLLIPKYGLLGASWVSVISSITQFSIGLIVITKRIKRSEA